MSSSPNFNDLSLIFRLLNIEEFTWPFRVIYDVHVPHLICTLFHVDCMIKCISSNTLLPLEIFINHIINYTPCLTGANSTYFDSLAFNCNVIIFFHFIHFFIFRRNNFSCFGTTYKCGFGPPSMPWIRDEIKGCLYYGWKYWRYD